MNSFITFENSENKIEYFFSKQHIVILLFSLIIIIFFSMYASRQRFKFQKIFVICSTILIMLLEAGRIVWQYFYLQYNGSDLTFLNITNLSFFTLSLWVSIPIIFIATMVKSKKKKNFGPLAFVFMVSSIVGITNFIYPGFLNGYFEFYHISNLISVLIRCLTIMIGLFFISANWIDTTNFLSFWKTFFAIVIFGIICVVVYYVLGQPENLFFLESVPLFESLGIYLSTPLQFILLGIFIFALQFLFFMPFHAYRKKKSGN